ncbi:MAG: hypothetical protein ABI151_05870 [Chitinophagaceae bacterium]
MRSILFALCFLYFNAHCQDVHTKELKKFLSYAIDSLIMKEVNENDTLIISNKTSSIDKLNDDCLKSFNTSFGLKQAEIDSFIQKASSTPTSILKTNDFDKMNFVLSADSKLNPSTKGTYCTISNPIFLQDYTYCLFAFDIAKGGGQTILFKKEGSKWRIYKRVCAWYY